MMRRRVGYTGTIFGSDLWAAAWRREKEDRKVSINKERRGSFHGRKGTRGDKERERKGGGGNILEIFLLAYNLVAPPSLRSK